MRGLFLVLALLAAMPALADDAAGLKHQNEAVLAATPEAAGLFALQDDGTIKHLASGLVCPSHFPNAVFYHLLVYAKDGSDVGCDYRRADDKGGAWAKLTIFAVRAKPDTTADGAFAQYRGELLQAYPDAKPQGPGIVPDKSKSDASLLDFRSEQFLITMNNQTYTTQLYVAVVKGWTVEIRTTFVGAPNEIVAGREGPNSVADEMGDRLIGSIALIGAIGTINP
jgi:hypothetical protein